MVCPKHDFLFETRFIFTETKSSKLFWEWSDTEIKQSGPRIDSGWQLTNADALHDTDLSYDLEWTCVFPLTHVCIVKTQDWCSRVLCSVHCVLTDLTRRTLERRGCFSLAPYWPKARRGYHRIKKNGNTEDARTCATHPGMLYQHRQGGWGVASSWLTWYQQFFVFCPVR